MKKLLVIALLVAACGGTADSAPPGSHPASAADTAPPTALPVAAAPTPTASPPPGPSVANLDFILCPSVPSGVTCQLEPGPYTAAIHDAYSLAIPDAGWQEQRAADPASEEPTVVLARIDAPDERLIIDSGPTSLILTDEEMAVLLAGAAGFQSNAPAKATVGSATGYQVDLAPTKVEQLTVGRAGTYIFEPGHRYRLLALQDPMGQESALKVIIIDAPTATFDGFLGRATAVLDTVRFGGGS